MENKKGFTLIELLAVIIILSLLALLTSTAVTKLVKDSKTDLNSIQLKSLKSSAEAWGAENMDLLPSSGTCGYMTLRELKEYGIVDSEIKDLTTNQELEDTLYIKITNTLNDYGKEVFTYEVTPKEEDIDRCLKLYKEKVELFFGSRFSSAIKTLANGTHIIGEKEDTKIKSIEFLSGGVLPEKYTLEELKKLPSTRVSEEENKPIMAYYDTTDGKVYIYSEDLITFNSKSDYMFFNFKALSSITFGKVDTSDVTSMLQMFAYCESLTNLDLSDFNTSSVINMSNMFAYCKSLTNIDVSNFDTSSVTNMQQMFHMCISLTSLNLSNFDTSSVINMDWMFWKCSSLTRLDLSNFDTSSVTNMEQMFYGCRGLTSLYLSNWNTSNVTNMQGMFSKCISLTSLDLSNFDTSSVINMEWMFSVCENLKQILVNSSTWNTANANTTDMFTDCGTSQVTPVY